METVITKCADGFVGRKKVDRVGYEHDLNNSFSDIEI
jgi:hypothetical protein